MTPTRMAQQKEDLVERRKKAVLERQTTTHWPHEFHAASSALPEDYYEPSKYMRLVPSLVTGNAEQPWVPQRPTQSATAQSILKEKVQRAGGVAFECEF